MGSGEAAVLVTGSTGFVGSHLVDQLCQRGEKVRVLVRAGSNLKNLEGLNVERIIGDLLDPASLERALNGCRTLYHAAADYRLWTLRPEELYQNNVQGTRNILEAARKQKVERVVYTSTVGAIGFPKDGSPGNETTPVTLKDMVGHYKRSKFFAEAEVRSAVQAGLAVVTVNPSTPVGSRDIKPTPTGQMIVDFLNGKMPAFVDTGLNMIDVEDVARGHLLAMEKGEVGERYILGSQNLTMKEIMEILSQIVHRPAPTVQLPRWVALSVGAISTGISGITHRPPQVPLEGVRMAGKKMYFDSSKAVKVLGLPQGSVEDALRKAVNWFSANGYLNTRSHSRENGNPAREQFPLPRG